MHWNTWKIIIECEKGPEMELHHKHWSYIYSLAVSTNSSLSGTLFPSLTFVTHYIAGNGQVNLTQFNPCVLSNISPIVSGMWLVYIVWPVNGGYFDRPFIAQLWWRCFNGPPLVVHLRHCLWLPYGPNLARCQNLCIILKGLVNVTFGVGKEFTQ